MRVVTRAREAAQSLTPNTAGLILLDDHQRVLYFNPEALKILTYPDPIGKNAADSLPRLLHPWLEPGKRLSRARALPDFKSGRRRYALRSLSLAPSTGKSAQATTGILLERMTPTVLNISAAARQFQLTEREKETVELLTLGLTSKEIASRMKISPNTVKAFFRLVMTKMSVSTRSGIVGKIARAQSMV